jgi:hypothetical protein
MLTADQLRDRDGDGDGVWERSSHGHLRAECLPASQLHNCASDRSLKNARRTSFAVHFTKFDSIRQLDTLSDCGTHQAAPALERFGRNTSSRCAMLSVEQLEQFKRDGALPQARPRRAP